MLADAAGRAPIVLPLLFHIFSNFGAVWFSPVMLALFATRAPERWRGTLVGINSLSIATGSIVSGRMGSLYEQLDQASFWLLNAAFCLVAAVAMMLLRPVYRRLLDRSNAEDRMPMAPKQETAVVADPA